MSSYPCQFVKVIGIVLKNPSPLISPPTELIPPLVLMECGIPFDSLTCLKAQMGKPLLSVAVTKMSLSKAIRGVVPPKLTESSKEPQI